MPFQLPPAVLRLRPSALLLPLALAACGGSDLQRQDIASLDEELASNGDDPLLAATVQDQIMVDPLLETRANADAVRPPSQPYAAPIPAIDVAEIGAEIGLGDDGALMTAPAPSGPCRQCAVARDSLTLAALAARQRNPRTSGCAARVRYAAGWANRLPADLPLYPRASVVEAAGVEGGGCSLRAVSFSVARPMQTMLDWYYTRAAKAGYSAEHQTDGDQHILGGTRTRGDGAYVVFMTARPDGGTDLDLIVNTGG